jgi:tRNA-2-methylthio-N6-dimethylallyladenosine synthase
MNVADTEQMSAQLCNAGLTPATNPKDADLIIVNGCSVREKPVHKAVSELGRYRVIKDRKKHSPQPVGTNDSTETKSRKQLIALGGCVGQLDKGKILEKAPYVDFVFGPDAIDELPEIIHRVSHGDKKRVYTEFDQSEKYSMRTMIQDDRSQAFVNIMKGCDKYCSYCIVPFTRGKEKSRTIDEVLDDLAALTEKGIKEITLLGQNVNSFGKGNKNLKNRKPIELHNAIGKVGPRPGDENFPQLLYAIDKDSRLSQIKRIRFTSSHPLDFSDELLNCYLPREKGGVGKLARHLHLPVQSGSNRILQKMLRHHKIEDYKDQILRLKKIAPDVSVSTDLIVGFPTETELDFQETLRLMSELELDAVYAFAYSTRPGTKAAKYENDISLEEKDRRLKLVLKLQKTLSEKKMSEKVDQVLEILVEGPSKNNKMEDVIKKKTAEAVSVWMGRTSCNRPVHFINSREKLGRENLKGHFVKTKIIHSTPLALYGELDS